MGALELEALWLAAWELVYADPIDAGNVDDLLEVVLVGSGNVGAVELAALWLAPWEPADAHPVGAGNVDDDPFDVLLVDSGNVGAVELAALWLAAWELADFELVDAGNVDDDLVDGGSVDADQADCDPRRSVAPTLETPALPSATPGSGPAGTTPSMSVQAANTAALLRSERRERQRKAP